MRESIKIQLPEDTSDITLAQSLRYISITQNDSLSDVDKAKKIVRLFTGLKTKEIDAMSIGDYEQVMIQVIEALSTEAKFSQKFKLNGIEYGFIPNLDSMTAGEYIDLTNLTKEEDSIHKTMAILFRPIVKRDGLGSYTIEPYRAESSYQEIMKHAPISAVNGMMVFFCLLLNELQVCMVKSTEGLTEEARRKQVTTS